MASCSQDKLGYKGDLGRGESIISEKEESASKENATNPFDPDQPRLGHCSLP